MANIQRPKDVLPPQTGSKQERSIGAIKATKKGKK